MVKLLQNQALNTTLARQHNLGYASSPKYLIFLYFNPSLQNSNDKFGFNYFAESSGNLWAPKDAMLSIKDCRDKNFRKYWYIQIS